MIMMMILGLESVVIVVAMAVPMIVSMVVALAFRIMTVFITLPGHKSLEVLWTLGVVMVLLKTQ